MTTMAIVKATYTKSRGGAKASLRYIQHRPGRDGERMTRELFSADGTISRQDAYELIDAAEKGSTFFRIVISPDPRKEDTYQDLYLAELTAQTMTTLEERLAKPVPYIGTAHTDHSPNRHVHILAVMKGRLNPQDLQALREAATQAALLQRGARDAQRDKQQQRQEGMQWGL